MKLKYLYGVIILGAILTTAISSAYSFLKNISKNEKQYKKYNICVCSVSALISLCGFSNLINNIYPIFGILGFIQLFFLLKCK